MEQGDLSDNTLGLLCVEQWIIIVIQSFNQVRNDRHKRDKAGQLTILQGLCRVLHWVGIGLPLTSIQYLMLKLVPFFY